METLTIEEITQMQVNFNVGNTQAGINSGEIWKFEGSVGRFAMDCLNNGICFLPEERTQDYYGNTIPSRNDVKPGTTGSLELAQEFWSKVHEGDFEVIEALSEMFGESEEEDES